MSEKDREQGDIDKLAKKTLKDNKVAIFIVAYNAESHIEKVLERIPEWVAKAVKEIYIIDDHSTDSTLSVAEGVKWPKKFAPLRIYETPYNQGYGGNQQLGFKYAIDAKFDIVVLLHGDGQYAPEELPAILAPYAQGADAVFGSRFINPGDALKGGMPYYKWIGNRILTSSQSFITGINMIEMHSGYRSYRVSLLKEIPFQFNSQWFDFDADIIIQLHAKGYKVKEVPIPTYYGNEICRVNGMLYAWKCVKTALKYKLMKFDIFYDPKFDFRDSSSGPYTVKSSRTSLHHYIRSLDLKPGGYLVDIGGGANAGVSKNHASRGVHVDCIDAVSDGSDSDENLNHYKVDLDKPWRGQFPAKQYDYALALDVLEHLQAPEDAAMEIYKRMKAGGKLYASTANIAYFPIRLVLLAGFFSYGPRGILDFTHRRLFTIKSMSRLLKNSGFIIDRVVGFGPPIRDATGGKSFFYNAIDTAAAWLAKLFPGLFAFQILMECTRSSSPEDLMKQVFTDEPHSGTES